MQYYGDDEGVYILPEFTMSMFDAVGVSRQFVLGIGK